MDAIFIPLIISLLFLLYFYYLFACGKLYEGRTKNLVFLFLAVFLLDHCHGRSGHGFDQPGRRDCEGGGA